MDKSFPAHSPCLLLSCTYTDFSFISGLSCCHAHTLILVSFQVPAPGMLVPHTFVPVTSSLHSGFCSSVASREVLCDHVATTQFHSFTDLRFVLLCLLCGTVKHLLVCMSPQFYEGVIFICAASHSNLSYSTLYAIHSRLSSNILRYG